MSRQVRLDDDVVELVEALNPEELSLSGRTNEILRALLTMPTRGRDLDRHDPQITERGTRNAERVPERQRRRRRTISRAGCPVCGSGMSHGMCMICGARQ